MKDFTSIVIISTLLLTGCSSQFKNNKPLYLKTEMQSPVSGVTKYVNPVDSLLKENSARHFILYTLRPLPGKTYRDDLDKKYTTAIMYIELMKVNTGYVAEISGDINYYDTVHYVDEKLVGDVIKSVSIPLKIVTLKDQKPVSIELPRGIKFFVKLSEDTFMEKQTDS